jgi:hypothetical protein
MDVSNSLMTLLDNNSLASVPVAESTSSHIPMFSLRPQGGWLSSLSHARMVT